MTAGAHARRAPSRPAPSSPSRRPAPTLDGDTLTYAWDFGDTTSSTQQNPTKTYPTAGTYAAKVTVSDGKGGTGEATLSVVVAGANLNPTVTAARTPTGNTRVGVPVAFTATGHRSRRRSAHVLVGLRRRRRPRPSRTRRTRSPTAATFTRPGHGLRRQGRHGHHDAQRRRPGQPQPDDLDRDGDAERRHRAADDDVRGHGHGPRRPRGDLRVGPRRRRHVRDHDAEPDVHLHRGQGLRPGAARHRRLRRLGHPHADHQRVPGGAGPERALQRARLLQDGRVPPLARSRTALAAIRKLGTENNFTVDATEDASLFTDAFLSRYDLVVFNSTTGDVLTDTQQAAFERFIKAGHGYTGIHSATDTEYGWAWYGQLTGALLPQPSQRHADRDGRRGRRHEVLDGTPAGALVARGRVVQLPGHRQPGGQRRRHGRQPAWQHADPRAADDGRVDLRRGRRHGRRRRRSPDRLVQALRRRPDVLHRAGAHRCHLHGARTSSSTCSGAWRPRPA